MKLHVVYAEDGAILGVARADAANGIQVRPRADEKAGERAAEVAVPAEYEHHDMAGILRELRVDIKGTAPELKPKG
jgi:hypothetical protein